MLYSSSCEYGIRALVHLARREGGRPILVRDIAEEENIPRHYLAKILQQLAGHGLVKSTKGPGGGFSLAQAAKDVTVRQVVNLLEPSKSKRQCVLGLDACEDDDPCPLHEPWKKFQDDFFARLDELTLADLAIVHVPKQD